MTLRGGSRLPGISLWILFNCLTQCNALHVRWKGPAVQKKTHQLRGACSAVYDIIWDTSFQACLLPLWLPLSSGVTASPLRVLSWVFHSPHHASHVHPADVSHQMPISRVFAVFFILTEKRYFYNMSIKVEKQKIDQESTLFFLMVKTILFCRSGKYS